jgi:hypothetical protein
MLCDSCSAPLLDAVLECPACGESALDCDAHPVPADAGAVFGESQMTSPALRRPGRLVDPTFAVGLR